VIEAGGQWYPFTEISACRELGYGDRV